MKISFYLEGVKFAQRRSEFIPRVGDEIRFNSIAYSIDRVVWIEDETSSRVVIDITKI
jgi:hypothetical protein